MIPEGFIPTQRVESQLYLFFRNVSWILVLICCVSPSENVFAQSDTRMIKEPMIGVGLASGLMDLTVAAKNSVIKVQKRREILRFESPLSIYVRAQSSAYELKGKPTRRMQTFFLVCTCRPTAAFARTASERP